MIPVATQIPITATIPILAAIGDRQWQQFKDLEADFVTQNGVKVWQEVFNFRVLPVLDKDSNPWLLIHWCGEGISWVYKKWVDCSMSKTLSKLLNISGGRLKKATTPAKERSLFVCNCLNVRLNVLSLQDQTDKSVFIRSRRFSCYSSESKSARKTTVSLYKGGSNDQNSIFR